MTYSTTNTYKMKRGILNFAEKISKGLHRPEQKFYADMCYGTLAADSCLLTQIAQQLHEDTKKINIVDRLSKHLTKGVSQTAVTNYLREVRKWLPEEKVIFIDDSDVIKPEGYCFEALGWVRDGSASTKEKSVYKKGYHVTEACALTTSNHPVSVFSRIHSSAEKNFTSANDITFAAIERSIALCQTATFVMDRGYDDNKIFHKLFDANQNFVIRLTKKRKFYYHNKWIFATELGNRRKGKVKMTLRCHGADHEAWLSHVKVQLTACKREVWLVLVYGISKTPMMLVTNRPIRSKDDLTKVARLYFSRWKIEEYFRAKKQIFDFENFRVRSLKAINALKFCITVCMAFFVRMTMKRKNNLLFASIMEAAKPIKQTVPFLYYRLASGIVELLSCAKQGIKNWFPPLRPDPFQIKLRLPA